MQAMDDMALLREYAARHSEAAFEELVSRRIGFVYSAALRQVRDPHLAEEVTQAVFIILAQKAGKISDKTILTGWLFKTTRFAALAQIRAAAKRPCERPLWTGGFKCKLNFNPPPQQVRLPACPLGTNVSAAGRSAGRARRKRPSSRAAAIL